ncbi:MAG: hypothetical protein F6J87_16255 [Spirulina sp. SIO3F2]|nr:hypothetical protein [Spirulina sp. SIO3F2]
MLLDLLVGVTALPLFWPFDAHRFKLPFGLLPSAGKISLSNPYFYSNLKIELGVLLPLSLSVFALRLTGRWRWWLVIPVGGLLAIARHYAIVAYGLSR